MWPDEIVNDTRSVREILAQKYRYDVDAIFAALIEHQAQENRSSIAFQPKRIPAAVETDPR